ncbi:hypothetical protein [Phyllobacterium sp. SB3]
MLVHEGGYSNHKDDPGRYHVGTAQRVYACGASFRRAGHGRL